MQKIVVLLLLLGLGFAFETAALKPKISREAAENAGTQGMHFPCYSPDGKWLAFSLHGDIWKVPSTGGQAQRLTLHEADDIKPKWSPDGKTIAFASSRSGNFDIWTISSDGGQAVQVTFHSAWDSISTWSRDGQWLVFYSYRSGSLELWKIGKDGGIPIQITTDGGRDAMVSPDGNLIVYARGDSSMWRKGYHGSANWDIYTTALQGPSMPKQLTTFDGNEFYPCYTPDGKTIYYLREDDVPLKDGNKAPVFNLWKMGVNGESQTQVTAFDNDMMAPDLSSDGKLLVFEQDFRLWQMDLVELKVTPIPIEINSDKKSEQEIVRIISEGNEMANFSPDGQQIAFVLHGDIWIMSAMGGEARRITSGAAKDQWPRFAPDGKSLAYFSNKSGNNDIYILTLKTNEEFQLTNHPKDDFFQSWSPDGKYLLFTSERSGNRDIWRISSKGGMPQQLTDGAESEDDSVYSPDGKWIAFDSGKGGNQEIWIMPADGTYKDAQQLTQQGGLTQVPNWSPDSQYLAYENNDDEGVASIWVIARSGGNALKVVQQGSLPCWSPDGKWIMHESEKSDKKNVYRIEAPVSLKTSDRIPFFARIEVRLNEERKQIFEEAWQTIAQDFYDPKLHGIDWNAIKKKYLPLVEQAESDLEFGVLINKMTGELRASHMGFNEAEAASKIETGELGWELETVTGHDRILRVKEVLRDGPADKSWIRRGDYVFQVAGKEITPNLSVAQLLNNQVGKEVKIYVSPSLNPNEGRYVSIVPTTMQQIDAIKYRLWLIERIQAVRQGCRGKVVYIHLTEMNAVNLRKFREIVQETVDKADGMILDVRNNGGGLIHQELLDILTRKPFVAFQARGQERIIQPTLYWDKPVVLLINENSFSDAEVFAYGIKALQRGSIVGVPTAGGVIGTRDITLSNQMTFRVPRVGYYTLEGENMEGLGVKPDYLVPETPQDRAGNRDPQLLKAIELILAQIEKKPQAGAESKPKETK